MTYDECPNGTIATYGHPKNNVLIVKVHGNWWVVETGRGLHGDDYRMQFNPVWLPERRDMGR